MPVKDKAAFLVRQGKTIDSAFIQPLKCAIDSLNQL